MTLSYNKSKDELFISLVQQLKDAGVDMQITTTDQGNGELRRLVGGAWTTHSGIGAVLK